MFGFGKSYVPGLILGLGVRLLGDILAQCLYSTMLKGEYEFYKTFVFVYGVISHVSQKNVYFAVWGVSTVCRVEDASLFIVLGSKLCVV